ncbi:MAG: flagellar motor switch protein FliN, partial [Gammaproteobacteria bacterium]
MSDTPEGQGDFEAPRFEHPSGPPPQEKGKPRLDLILNIPVTLSMEIGRTRLSIGNLLALTPGSVVR